ncbi:MAG: M23 family metallopeptidase [Prevotella sp.]
MKTIPITIFISLSLSASAQFNTIVPVGSHLNKKVSPPVVDSAAVVVNNIVSKEREDEKPLVKANADWYHPPLKGKLHIISRFGHRRNPFGKKSSEFHSGIDLSAKAGTPIYAMLPGEVAHIGYDSRSGNYIKLRHGSFTVSYCHLIRKPNIPIGSKVFPGQPVAQVGSTGRSTGPHLHITLKRNGRVIDPMLILPFTL